MSVASIELCQSLFSCSGWDKTFNYWEYADGIPAGDAYLVQPDLIRRYGLWSTQEVKRRCPAYDVDFIWNHLPDGYTVLTRFNDGWLASWAPRADDPDYAVEAGSLADAACKLAITLFDRGEIFKERAA